MVAAKVIVNCKNYNGHANTLFMMKTDDFRLHDERFKDNYERVTTGKSRRCPTNGTIFVGDDKNVYKVFSDWSVKKMVGN